MKIFAYIILLILSGGAFFLGLLWNAFNAPNAFSGRDAQGAAGLAYLLLMGVLAGEVILYLIYFWISYHLISQGTWSKLTLLFSIFPILILLVVVFFVKL
ncbi:MAG: hypothetical protein K1X48_00015 [Burkholderiaceae bacterium]|nr:hypothetical protein [Burkholderiaceae bacterium]